ncbi:sugar kinase [Thalassobacillus sp. CUG 92003]|uniref:sugar kinase n=1 Tax=Thalassobacillus sp. CUG 92003 TaxID=2736641 RepID=UPI0015E63CC9|nr:sugar kinase [Thalassobacillus sp. CUG 92003]
MNDVITIGDGMITFDPASKGPMRYAHTFERKVGGAELNFALGCARLGLNIGWVSRLGADEFGRYIHNFMRGEGVDVSAVQLVEGYPTSLNFKEIKGDGSGNTFYYRANSPTLTLTKDTLDEAYVTRGKLLHITGVFAAVDANKNVDLLHHAVKLAKQNGMLVSLDPNIRLKLWTKDEAREALSTLLPYVDVLLTGVDEAELLFGVTDSQAIMEHCRSYNIDTVAIKKGADGAEGYHKGEHVQAQPVRPRKVVDTVGAGDGFDAGFIHGFLQGWSLEKILQFANTIGSMVVSVEGDNEGLPYLHEVLVQLGEKESVER